MRGLIDKLESLRLEEAAGTENPYASPHGKGFVVEFYHQRTGKVLAWRRTGFMNVAKGMKSAKVFKSVAEAEKFISKEAVPHIRQWMSQSWGEQINGWGK